MTILDAIADPHLFGPWFKDRGTWRAWMAFLATLFGLPMDASDRRIFRQCTGRARRPRKALTEAWLVVGRRGGKSFVLALVNPPAQDRILPGKSDLTVCEAWTGINLARPGFHVGTLDLFRE